MWPDIGFFKCVAATKGIIGLWRFIDDQALVFGISLLDYELA